MYRTSEFHPQPGLRRALEAIKITAAEMKATKQPRFDRAQCPISILQKGQVLAMQPLSQSERCGPLETAAPSTVSPTTTKHAVHFATSAN